MTMCFPLKNLFARTKTSAPYILGCSSRGSASCTVTFLLLSGVGPTLKLKRRVVVKKNEAIIDAMYAEPPPKKEAPKEEAAKPEAPKEEGKEEAEKKEEAPEDKKEEEGATL